jgi:1,2-diacylglycerol 3-beta-galactosyltransferase
MKRVLIFMSNTGGGHRASAEALKAAFAERYGTEFQVDIVDLWMDHTPWPLNKVPGSYPFLVDKAPWFYQWMWNMGKKPGVITPVMDVAARWAGTSILQAIQDHNPDLIIAVHPLLQEAPLKIMARQKHQVPFITVITDLAAFHPSWFHPEVSLCFVPNESAYRQALKAGLRPAQVRQCGLPIRPAFAQPPRPKDELRRELGMDSSVPAVLLAGGGEGMGPVGTIAQAVAARLAAKGQGRDRPAGQLVVICGRNRKLEERLNSLPWPIPTRINGFVDNVPDWMAACDCIITKAGPGTIAEAMARGLPMLLSGYIPSQETENVSYVVENGIGVYNPDPEQIAELVSQWLGTGRADLERMSQRARQLARPLAALEIVSEIASTLAQPELATASNLAPMPARPKAIGKGLLPRWRLNHKENRV